MVGPPELPGEGTGVITRETESQPGETGRQRRQAGNRPLPCIYAPRRLAFVATILATIDRNQRRPS